MARHAHLVLSLCLSSLTLATPASAQRSASIGWKLQPGRVIEVRLVDTLEATLVSDSTEGANGKNPTFRVTVFRVQPLACGARAATGGCDSVRVDAVADSIALVLRGTSSPFRSVSPFGQHGQAVVTLEGNGRWHLTDSTSATQTTQPDRVLADFLEALSVPLPSNHQQTGTYRAQSDDDWRSMTAGAIHESSTGTVTIQRLNDSLTRLQFDAADTSSANGMRTAGTSRATMFWNTRTGMPSSVDRAHRAVAIDPDGKRPDYTLMGHGSVTFTVVPVHQAIVP